MSLQWTSGIAQKRNMSKLEDMPCMEGMSDVLAKPATVRAAIASRVSGTSL